VTRLLPLSLLALGGLIGCARHAQFNSNCEWPQEIKAGALNPSRPSQQRHLSYDAEFAEDLAIRYADKQRGPRSGHFEGMAEYGRTRDQCMTALFRIIGSSHGVTQEQVGQSLGHRRTTIDVAIVLPFVVLFGFGANVVVRRIVRRHPAGDGWIGPVVMTTFAAIVTSAAGVLAGEQWSGLWENLRIGNGHLSYRVERIPWTHHRLGLFLGGMLLFGLLSGFQYFLARAQRSGVADALETSLSKWRDL
jgi:hypothetical protein